MKRLLHIFSLLVVLLLGTAPTIYAESVGTDFVRVTRLSEVEKGGIFLIGACNQNEKFCVLTAEGYTAKKTLHSEVWETFPDQYTGVITDAVQWEITPAQNGRFALRSLSLQQYLEPSAATTTGFTFSKSAAAKWSATTGADGTFHLQHTLASDRYLGVNTLAETFFGYYTTTGTAETIEIILYKKEGSTPDVPLTPDLPAAGSATAPTHGDLVSLWAEGFTACTKTDDNNSLPVQIVSGTFLPCTEAAECLLRNGKTARRDDIAAWVVKAQADGTFLLQDVNTGALLKYADAAGTESAAWRVQNGRIATTESKPRALYAKLQEDDDALTAHLCLLTATESATTSNLLDVIFRSLAPAPAQTLSDDGVLTLTGGWSTKDLAEISLQNVLVLDLLQAELPLKPEKFKQKPFTHNMPLFLLQDAAKEWAKTFKWVVGFPTPESSTGTFASSANFLADGEAFYTPRSIEYRDDDLSYERKMQEEGVWETLCLPFSFTLKKEDEALRFLSSTQEAVYFASIEEDASGERIIKENVPILIRSSRQDLNLMCEAGTIAAMQPHALQNTNGLHGTYRPIKFTGAEAVAPIPYYMLTATEQKTPSFQRVVAGCTLAPFRAYFYFNQNPTAAHIQATIVDHVRPICAEIPADDAPWYTLSGLRLSKRPASRGVYLHHGKKIILTHP